MSIRNMVRSLAPTAYERLNLSAVPEDTPLWKMDEIINERATPDGFPPIQEADLVRGSLLRLESFYSQKDGVLVTARAASIAKMLAEVHAEDGDCLGEAARELLAELGDRVESPEDFDC